MTAYERRLAIVEVLCLRRTDTRENLASEFGVSVRTIANDLTALSLTYPIYTVQGKGGGIYVDEDYRRERKCFTAEQTELLKRLSAGLRGKDAETMRSLLATFAPCK